MAPIVEKTKTAEEPPRKETELHERVTGIKRNVNIERTDRCGSAIRLDSIHSIRID